MRVVRTRRGRSRAFDGAHPASRAATLRAVIAGHYERALLSLGDEHLAADDEAPAFTRKRRLPLGQHNRRRPLGGHSTCPTWVRFDAREDMSSRSGARSAAPPATMVALSSWSPSAGA